MKFQNVPELMISGTYRSSFDVKSISCMTSKGYISDVDRYSCPQALFVTVFQTSVDLLCKNSYESGSLLGYLDCFLPNHIVGCCNINCSCLSQTRREKCCHASNVSIPSFCCTFLHDCSCLETTFGQRFTLRPPYFFVQPRSLYS